MLASFHSFFFFFLSAAYANSDQFVQSYAFELNILLFDLLVNHTISVFGILLYCNQPIIYNIELSTHTLNAYWRKILYTSVSKEENLTKQTTAWLVLLLDCWNWSTHSLALDAVTARMSVEFDVWEALMRFNAFLTPAPYSGQTWVKFLMALSCRNSWAFTRWPAMLFTNLCRSSSFSTLRGVSEVIFLFEPRNYFTF